jgi:replicative DNA helicase
MTRVLQDQDFQTLEKMRFDESYFTVPETREVFKYIRDTFHNQATFGQVPSLDMIRFRFPAFYFAPAMDTVQVLAHEMKKDKLRLDLQGAAQQILQIAEADPLSALAKFRQEFINLGHNTDSSEDLSISGAYHQLLERYNLVADQQGVIGIPFPWQVMTEETQGMQPGQFFILYGRPKSMKSWMATLIGVYAYSAARRRVLYVTREMPSIQVMQRAACILAVVDYDRFRKGKLDPAAKARVFNILRELKDDEESVGSMGLNQPFFIVTSDKSAKGGGGGGGGGVTWIQSKIRDLQPHLVIVDGMYLLKDDRSNQRSVDWKAIAHISQDLKLTSQEFDIPVFGVTQANRAAEKGKGEDLTELAYADAFGQDADGVFRVSKLKRIDDQTKQKHTELLITAPGLREGEFDGIVVNGKPAYDFSYIRTVVNLDDENSKEDYGDKKQKQDRPGGATGVRRNTQFQDPRLPTPR